MGHGFSCLQRNLTDLDETSKGIPNSKKLKRKTPPPPPRKSRPPPPPRSTQKKKKVVIVTDSTAANMKQTSSGKPSRKYKPKKSKKKCRNPNKLNIPSIPRKKSVSESDYSMTESYASALSVLSPAVSVISALSVAPVPFISNASVASNLSEVEESSSESSISIIRADNDTTASSLHSVADGYALVSQTEAQSESNPPSTTNMMEYVNSVIQVHMEQNKPTLRLKAKTPSTSTVDTDSLMSYDAGHDSLMSYDAGHESVYDATVHIQDEDDSDDDTDSEMEGVHQDCHECHECSEMTNHAKYGEGDNECSYLDEEEEDNEGSSTEYTQTANYLLTAPASVISTVSALSRYEDHGGNIFPNNYSMASQLSELSELSEEKKHNNVVTPTMQPLSPRQCYFAVKSTSVTPHATRNLSIGPSNDDSFLFNTKVPNIARFLRDAQYFHDMDAIDDDLAYVD